MNGLAQQIGTQLKTQFAPTIDKINDGIDVLKAGQDVVSTVVKDVTGQDVTIRSIQKGAADFDKKWDEFAKEINEKFNKAQSSGQADIMETFAKSHFGDDVYNLGSAIKNELPGVLDGIADYKDAIDSMKSDSKTAEEAAVKIQKGVDTIVEATQKVAGSLNKAVEICTGNGLPILDDLSKIGGSAAVGNLKKVIGVGVSGATAATAFNQMKDAAKNKDFKGITDAMAKGATAVDNLLSDLGNMVPGFPKAQIPSQITASISRLQNGQAVYDAARSMVTALVVDASGPITPKTLASLTSDFNKNWDTFSDKINALFNVSPTNGQTAVLETLGKNMFGPNVFNAAGAIKRQLPGVLEGIAGVQDALKQFGGIYRNPIEAATKIRNGVEKMVQSIEKIGQSLNNMVKHYQGSGIMANGTGYPLLDTLEKLGDTKGIQALDTTLRVCGGVAAVAGNAGAVAQAIKNKVFPSAIAAVKKTIDDVQKLTKKGNYKIDDGKGSKSGLPNNSSKASDASNNGQQNSPQNKNNLSSAATDSYVCSTATMKCTMGTSQAKLTVLPTRTVFLTGKPMANISDHLTMVNLAPFGRCRSMGFPATASATAANYGTLTPMPCMHNTPFPWMNGKNDYLIKGQPALLKSSVCQCMWGGTISITDDGQHGEGTQWVSKSQQDEFDKEQEFTKGLDVNAVLDGIQIALDVAGFVPGLGAIPDLTNAAISALRGNWTEAGLSVLAAVPIVGDAAAGAKLASRGVKIAKSMNKSANDLIKATKGLSKYEKKAVLAKEAGKYTGKNITAKELVAHGMSQEDAKFFMKKVRYERRNNAFDFYKKNTKMKDADIESHISGINYSMPVTIEKMPPVGKKEVKVFQYRNIAVNTGEYNIYGNYFTLNPHATPGELGIADIGVTIDKKIPGVAKNQLPLPFTDFPKEKYVGSVTEEVLCLRSTAKGVSDTWSVPGKRIYTMGGGEQLFIPNNSFASKMVKY